MSGPSDWRSCDRAEKRSVDSDVYRVTVGGVTTPAAMDTGMDVVGAGVSTRALTE